MIRILDRWLLPKDRFVEPYFVLWFDETDLSVNYLPVLPPFQILVPEKKFRVDITLIVIFYV